MKNALNNQVGMLGDMNLWLVANLKQGVIYFINRGAGIINEHKCISLIALLIFESIDLSYIRGSKYYLCIHLCKA